MTEEKFAIRASITVLYGNRLLVKDHPDQEAAELWLAQVKAKFPASHGKGATFPLR